MTRTAQNADGDRYDLGGRGAHEPPAVPPGGLAGCGLAGAAVIRYADGPVVIELNPRHAVMIRHDLFSDPSPPLQLSVSR